MLSTHTCIPEHVIRLGQLCFFVKKLSKYPKCCLTVVQFGRTSEQLLIWQLTTNSTARIKPLLHSEMLATCVKLDYAYLPLQQISHCDNNYK